MKTVTIEQTYSSINRYTFVSCYYKDKRVFSNTMEDTESLEGFTFKHLKALGFTHWKPKNGMFGKRKIIVKDSE